MIKIYLGFHQHVPVFLEKFNCSGDMLSLQKISTCFENTVVNFELRAKKYIG